LWKRYRQKNRFCSGEASGVGGEEAKSLRLKSLRNAVKMVVCRQIETSEQRYNANTL